MAARAELSPVLIAEIERERSDPTWGDMRKVAEALGVTLEELSELAEQFEAEGS